MPTKIDNRERLLRAAATTIYAKGFRQTTLADIAAEAKVPLGNVYYYYKSKDDIGKAVVDRLLENVRQKLALFDEAATPKERLCGYVDAVVATKDMVARGGCPVGSLCTELHKTGGELAEFATTLFEEQLTWMERQFHAMGRNAAEARRLAAHLLATLQGTMVLAHSFGDAGLIVKETADLKKWIRSL